MYVAPCTALVIIQPWSTRSGESIRMPLRLFLRISLPCSDPQFLVDARIVILQTATRQLSLVTGGLPDRFFNEASPSSRNVIPGRLIRLVMFR